MHIYQNVKQDLNHTLACIDVRSQIHQLPLDEIYFNLYTNMYSLNDLIYNYLLEFNKISKISHLFKNWSSLYIIYDNDSNEYELINLDNKTIKKLAELGLAIQTHINNFE